MNGQDLKNSILQLAIQGKLVPQDPNDEPASELLAKIRKEKERLVKEKNLKKKDLVTTPISDEEKPFEIPDSWEWCRLGEIFSHNNGKQLNRTDTQGEYHDYITTSNLYWDKFDLNEIRQMLFTKEELNRCTVTKGDILVCEGGDVGRSAIWNYDYDICIQNHIHRVRAYIPLCTRFYLYILMFNKAIGLIGGKGIGIQGFSSKALHNTLVPLPPLSEQHRIVEKLDELMPLVEEYDKAQTKLDKLNSELPEQLKQSILQEAIMGKLGTQDPNDEPASELLMRIRKEKERLVKEKKIKKEKALPEISDEEKPFDIPDNWVWCRLGKLVNMRIGKTPARSNEKYWSNGVYPWVSISDMTDYSHIRLTKEMVSQYAADNAFGAISEPGTLIMSFKLTVGRTCILDIAAYHNEAIISIDTYCDPESNLRDYLFKMLPLLANLGESKDAIKGKTLNSDSLSNLLIPLPPLAEQHRIVEKLDKLMQKIDKLRN